MIVGINGPIGSGKNEVAKILEKNHGYKAVGFADKLKKSAAAVFDIDPWEWEIIKNDPNSRISIQFGETHDNGGKWLREKSITGREFLKRYGTEAHRDVFGYDFWVDALLFGSDLSNENLAIYDARFDNELSAIRSLGGKNIQVRRPGREFDPSHPSETSPNADLIDYAVINDGTLEDLEEKINDLVEGGKLLGQRQ